MSAARTPLRIVVAATLVFATAGALEGVSIAALYGAPWRWTLHASAGFALVALFWVPVTLAVLQLWDREPRGRRLAAWLAVGLVVVVVAQPLWQAWVNPLHARRRPPYVVRLASLSDTNVAFFLAIVGFAWLAAARRAHADATEASARLEAALVDLELQVLTSQLHPHFLFNTLNLVSQLAYEDEVARARHARQPAAPAGRIDRARRAAGGADARRAALRAGVSRHPAVAVRRCPACRDRRGAGSGRPRGPAPAAPAARRERRSCTGWRAARTLGEVRVRAARAGDRLAITIEDDGVGMPPSVHEGMGLANTRLRLQRLYGDDFSLRYGPRADGGTAVTVELPARERSARSVSESESAPSVERAELESSLLARLRRAPLALRVVVAWSAVAIVWTEVSAAAAVAGGMAFDRPRVLAAYGLNAVVWMALTPIVLWLVRRVDGRAATRVWRGVTYVAAGASTVLAHLLVWLAVLRWLVPSQFEHVAALGGRLGAVGRGGLRGARQLRRRGAARRSPARRAREDGARPERDQRRAARGPAASIAAGDPHGGSRRRAPRDRPRRDARRVGHRAARRAAADAARLVGRGDARRRAGGRTAPGLCRTS